MFVPFLIDRFLDIYLNNYNDDFNMVEYSKDFNASQVLFCYGIPTNISAADDPKTLLALIIINIFISITATLENLLVLVTIWRRPNLHSPSNTLLFGLALSDLCVGFVAGPVNAGFHFMHFTKSGHLNSCTLMKIRILITLVLTAVTLLSVTAMSADRYLTIYLHLSYEQVVTERKIRQLILFLWLISGVYPVIFILDTVVANSCLALTIAICLFIVSFAWIKIYKVVRHHQAQIHDQMNAQAQQFNMAKFKKSAINTMFILILLLVCYLPLLVSKIALAFSLSSSNVLLLHYSYVLVFLNSTLNPLVYCWRQRDLRAGVKQTVMKLCCKN